MADLHPALTWIWITDGRGDIARILAIVRSAVSGGLRCIQVREPSLSASALAQLCDALRRILAEVDGLLLVNDRVDVVLAGHGHGIHLRGDSLPVREVRKLMPRGLLGRSVHNAHEAASAARDGADYVILAPVFPSTKPTPALGPSQAAAIAAATPIPTIWLGGIESARLPELKPYRPAGIAVMRALAESTDPARVAKDLTEGMNWK